MASKRVHYDASIKRKMILCAEANGNRAAARKFDTDEKNIRRWRKQRKLIFACKSSTKSFTGPKKGRYPEVDDSVAQFVRDARSKALPVTIQMLQCKAKEVIHKFGIENFKASRGWCEKFMRREGFSLRRRTSICQKLPADFDDKLVQFQRHVIDLRRRYAYEFKHIGNADETPLYFDMPRNYTVNAKGEKQVNILSTGYEKQRITVMLCVTADGHKLPPYLILNRKLVPKNENFPKDVIIRAQKNGWMTGEIMEDWAKSVWNKRPGALRNPRNMLVMDAFKGHLTDPLKNKLRRNNCDLVIIPGGMTSQLQPLDVSINKPFKDYVKREYENWLHLEKHPLTPSGKIKKASASKIAEWVSVAWKKVSNETIIHSFKKCCITNALDGTEDDIVWENDVDEASTSSEVSCDSESNESFLDHDTDS